MWRLKRLSEASAGSSKTGGGFFFKKTVLLPLCKKHWLFLATRFIALGNLNCREMVP